MQFYFQEEVWDEQKIRSTSSFADNYIGQTLKFCQDWLAGKSTFQLQTSGSTGKPKLIKIERFQMQESAKATAQKLTLQAQNNALICLNTNYIAGRMMLVRCMEVGMNARIIEPCANPFLETHDEKFDFTALVPMQLQTILEQSPEKLTQSENLKIIVGGAPVNYKLFTQLQKINLPIYATYGMTETVSHIALKRLNGAEKQDFYETLPHVEIAQDKRGCLTISAPMSKNKTLITNDKVRLISANQFEWLGRIDNIINSGGVKIQAEKIDHVTEKSLSELGLNLRCVTLGIKDEKLGEKIILCLEVESLSHEIEEKLIEKFQERLTRYEIPKTIICLPKFPETPTKKVNRKKIIQNLPNKL